MALVDYQMSFANVTVGPETNYDIVVINGLEDLSVRTSDIDFPRSDGAIPGLHLARKRTVTVEFEVNGTDAEDAEANYTTLVTAWQRNNTVEYPLTFKFPGRSEEFIRARITRRVRSRALPTQFGNIPCIFQLVATDPRTYGIVEYSVPLHEFSLSNYGTDFPTDFPINFPESTTITSVVTNAGDADVYPLISIKNGGSSNLTSIAVMNQTTGVALTLSPVLASGQSIFADMDVIVRGLPDLAVSVDRIVSAYADWDQPRDLFALQPGDNVIRVDYEPAGSKAMASILWRNTRL